MEDDLNSPTPQPKPPPSLPCPPNRPTASEMEELSLPSSDEAAAAVWEWGSLLDFSIDDADPLILPWAAAPEISPIPSPPPPPPPLPPPPAAAAAGPKKSGSRVRKRDPRLVCENYLAGRVPCACPEMDEMEAEEEEEVVAAVAGGRVKRTRGGGGGGGGGGGSAAVAAAATARCQVPGCEADIRELKGYHRRHRVCLRCANAASVMLDGEPKRYCQQCGKFHILTDFDEGKRSCRRKLERHNKRRRRRPDFRSVVEQETQSDLLADASCDGEPKEELTNGFACDTVETVVSNKLVGRETQPESEDGRGSPVCSLLNSQNVQSNSVVSFTASAEAHTDERIDNSKSAFSSTFGDNKSTYSSVCPTGRISFKLYDWNPAEFPRRLRHQIFQWLANMPVELEGYIRPGCTILTAFIAMPQFMWEKITDDAAGYVSNLVNGPESLFMGRGNIFIYLSNMIIHVLKDGTLLTNIKMEVKAPRLHYVHPAYFEVGKPVELFACGSNLDQPKFRFLVSFAGKYLNYDSCCHISHGNIQSYEGYRGNAFHSSEHEMLRVCIKHIDPKLAGPAFVEVENESGVSNFIPIIFGSKSICSELERIQRASTESLCTYSFTSQNAISVASAGLCGQLVSGQSAVSELLVDMAWLLKQPCLDEREAVLTSVNIQRLTCLLKYSIQNELFNILEVILHYAEVVTGGAGFHMSENMHSDADLKLLVEYMNHAREIRNQRAEHDIRSEVESESLSLMPFMHQSYVKSSSNCTTPVINEDAEACSRYGQGSSVSEESDECIPLISNEVIHRNHCYPKLRLGWPREPWANIFLRKVTGARHGVFITVSLAMCFGACIILLHPHKAGEVAASMRRCVFGDPIG